MTTIKGFEDERSEMYQKAMEMYPHARAGEFPLIEPILDLKLFNKMLEVGGGSNHMRTSVYRKIGNGGKLVVSDPSFDQLSSAMSKGDSPDITDYLTLPAEDLNFKDEFDRIFSMGAFHHISDQTRAMTNIYNALKPGGKSVICDVFQGSQLARHFDAIAARYCVTGHEVKFLSDEFARSLCHLAGFEDKKVHIQDLPLQWEFDSERSLGEFVYYLHAMTKLPGDHDNKIRAAYEGCKDILEIIPRNNRLYLQWPLKALIAEK